MSKTCCVHASALRLASCVGARRFNRRHLNFRYQLWEIQARLDIVHVAKTLQLIGRVFYG